MFDAFTNGFTIINNLMSKLWNSLNPLNPISSRISYNMVINNSFYCLTGKNNITRINIAWLIDNDEPNEIYFNSPTVDDLYNLFSSVNIKIYNEIPFQINSLYLKNFDNKNLELISTIVSLAWSMKNQNFDSINFKVSVLEKSTNSFTNR